MRKNRLTCYSKIHLSLEPTSTPEQRSNDMDSNKVHLIKLRPKLFYFAQSFIFLVPSFQAIIHSSAPRCGERAEREK